MKKQQNISTTSVPSVCLYCGENLIDGAAYIAGGACVDYTLEDEGREIGQDVEDILSGYLSIGFHPNPDDCAVSFTIVDDEEGGQFEIAFCSLKCLKKYLVEKIDKLEKEYRDKVACACSMEGTTLSAAD